MAANMAMKTPKPLSMEEMENLVSQLFSSSMPGTSPDGKSIITVMGEEDINKLF
jgi:DNA mismatch repair protein MutL